MRALAGGQGQSWLADSVVLKPIDDPVEAAWVADVRSRWPDVLAVGRAFSEQLATVPKPAFVDGRTHAWSYGDRVAWGEAPATASVPEFGALAAKFAGYVEPSVEPAQVVHGDLTANVLFGVGLPPAVIDFSPYYRPASYAQSIVVADAVAWHDEGLALARLLAGPGPRSMLARAALYRLFTSDRLLSLAPGTEKSRVDTEVAAFERVYAVLATL